MHRCLTILEVQLVIFRQIRNDFTGKKTPAKLARTCRTFSDTALNVLWAKVDSIVYLILCLPEDLWEIRKGTCKTMRFQRDMSLSDWETFSRYSSRVRTLSAFCSNRYCDDLGDDVILALSQPPNYVPLVPSLQVLDWGGTPINYVPLFQVLLTPTLVEVTLPSFPLCYSATSHQFTSRCPSLKHVRICTDTDFLVDVDGLKTMSEAISRLHSLELLECQRLDEAAIVHLSRLPSLTKLSLENQDDLQVENVMPYLAPAAFASLESLELRINKLSTLTSLLQPAVQLRLQKVSFVVVETPTPNVIHLFCHTLAKASRPERLSHISLTQSMEDWEWLPAADRGEISLSTLQPLLTFSNMGTFTLDIMCNLSLDDAAINTLSKHWPKLTELSLNDEAGWGIKSSVTHRGLIKLFSRCTALTELTLAVDFTGVDRPYIPTSRPGHGVTSRCWYASFITSEIHHPVTIAAFLSDLCPRLETVESASSQMFVTDGGHYMRRWDEVNNWLPAFQAVRKQCAKWYRRGGK